MLKKKTGKTVKIRLLAVFIAIGISLLVIRASIADQDWFSFIQEQNDQSSIYFPLGFQLIRFRGIPQLELGCVYNADGSIPADGQIQFVAYIVGREDDMLTEVSTGCQFTYQRFCLSR